VTVPVVPGSADVLGVPLATSGAELDRSLVRGLAWTGVVRWTSQILSWLSTIVVARLLAPGDYGLVGMAAVYLGLVMLVNDFGLGSALIQGREVDEDAVARVGGMSIAISLGFCVVSVLAAIPIARFFGEPAVRGIVLVSSLGFIASGFQVLPRSLLARELRFQRLALADGVEAIIASATTLLLAAAGARYWALVIGPLVSRLVSTLLLWSWRPHRLASPWPVSRISHATRFGGHLTLGRLAWYGYSNADFIIVGRLLGRVALGAYSLGWTIASIPVDRITALIGSVTPPILASVQNDFLALQRYLRLLTEALAVITFPVAVGLALVVDQAVPLLLGPHWGPAIRPLQLLALGAAFRSITPMLPQVAVAIGATKRNMQLTLIVSVVLPILFLIGSRWGISGVAFAWLIGHPLCVFPLYLHQVLRLTDMKLGSYLGALWPAAALTSVMAAAVWGVRIATRETLPPLSLGLEVFTGAAVYAGLLLLFYRNRAMQAKELLWPKQS
jgi:O-antigen/teichoic acid export membrane protein